MVSRDEMTRRDEAVGLRRGGLRAACCACLVAVAWRVVRQERDWSAWRVEVSCAVASGCASCEMTQRAACDARRVGNVATSVRHAGELRSALSAGINPIRPRCYLIHVTTEPTAAKSLALCGLPYRFRGSPRPADLTQTPRPGQTTHSI